MTKNIEKIFIMNHTHWDREWYLDFDTYRSKLKYGILDLVEKIENGIISNFFFDGQTIILEDVKDVLDDEVYSKFINYIKNGVIELGPWYILPDEFISDEESIIENLRVGREIANSHNSRNDFGYFPDAFGHIGQIPHLLKQFEIDHVLIHRGTKNSPFLTKWKASNKRDQVNSIILNLREGYYQTIFHTPIEYFEIEFEKFYERAIVNVGEENSLLIMNGCDHTFPPNDFNKKLDILRNKYPNIIFEEVTFSKYIDSLNEQHFNTIVIEGEQKDTNKAFVLPSVSSTRTHLKKDNRNLIDLLTMVAEPFEVITGQDKSNEKQIKTNFKNALKNQPHDSILGCSIDEVVMDMETRTRNSVSSIKSMINYKMDRLSNEIYNDFNSVFNNKLQVLNNNISNKEKLVSLEIKVPKSIDKGGIKLKLNDEYLEFNLNNSYEEEVLLASVNNAPSYQQYMFYEIEYYQKPTDRFKFDNIEIELVDSQNPIGTFNDFNSYEDESIKIFIEDNNIFAKGKNSKICLTSFKANIDVGDSYNYSPLNDLWNESELISSQIRETEINSKFKFKILHKLHKNISIDRITPSNEMVENIYEVELVVKRNSGIIDTKISMKNKASDVKIVQDLNLDTNYVLSDQAFELVKREKILDTNYEAPGENNSEISYPQFNSIRLIHDPVNKIQINHIGINEWEILNGKLSMTLLRNIGWLSRRDMKSRKGGAGPSYKINNAQGIGTHTFNYSIDVCSENIDMNRSSKLIKTPHHQSTSFFRHKEFDLSWALELMLTRFKNNNDEIEVRLVNLEERNIKINLPLNSRVINLAGSDVKDFDGVVKSKETITVLLKGN